MSLRTGSKRKAAQKVTYIELSDDEEPPQPKRKPKATKEKTVDAAAASLEANAAKTLKTKKWPTKKATSESIENLVPNVANDTDDTPSSSMVVNPFAATRNPVPDVAAASPAVGNVASTSIAKGRSSFWERRKPMSVAALLAETENIAPNAAQNIVQLLENENTIPFICRYRRDLVDHISADRLRGIKNSYTDIVALRKKAETIVRQLNDTIDEDVRIDMLSAKTTDELDFLYAPYKPDRKSTLAERAKALGLEKYADAILEGDSLPDLARLVDHRNPDLCDTKKVHNGIAQIMSHKIAKNTAVLEELRRLSTVYVISLLSSKKKGAQEEATKFENYADFRCSVANVKPHQYLAICRGEKLKCLKVSMDVPSGVKHDMLSFIGTLFNLNSYMFKEFYGAIEECYGKKLEPLLIRQLRSELSAKAKKSSIETFANNLKHLLLMSPVKGERILGIDPGFANGCKLAVISETADVLETGVVYPHKRDEDPERAGALLAKILARHNCSLIALGNGKACRETEFWLNKLMDLCMIDRRVVRYSIVSEQGASIYSCSEQAKKEFPDLDVNVISAVSIARRLCDPLSEYSKIEARHIGVGMYQHDINDRALTDSVNEVVSECISYVGVDINTAGLSVLKHVAGLTEKRADHIIQHRTKHGPFLTRKDLLKVKMIGEKTFTQCAGFVRIEPLSTGGKLENILDCTWVHPESYAIAYDIIDSCGESLSNVGKPSFIANIRRYEQSNDMRKLGEKFKLPKERLEVVFQALQRELLQDYRAELNNKPLFKKGITRLSDLSPGQTVTGAVNNVVAFGAFVDIGVESNGLIHASKLRGAKLNVGDRVKASIVTIDMKSKRIGLQFEQIIDGELDDSLII